MTSSSDRTTSDRRRAARLPGEAFASLLFDGLEGCDQAFCVVVDVSKGGMRLRTPQPPPSGQSVRVRVALGEDICDVRGRVVRVAALGSHSYDVGLAYDPDSEQGAAFLRTFLGRRDPAS